MNNSFEIMKNTKNFKRRFNKIMQALNFICCGCGECRSEKYIKYKFYKIYEKDLYYEVHFICYCKNCGWKKKYVVVVNKNIDKLYISYKIKLHRFINNPPRPFKIEVI